MNYLIPIYLHIPVFFAIYFVIDALHDTWFRMDKEWAVKASYASDPTYRKLCRSISKNFNKKWHALDAGIKAYVIMNLAYAFYGLDWVILFWGLAGGFLRWILFDLSWNAFNGMRWNYRGVIAWLDRLKVSDTLYFIIKLTGLGVSIYLIIISF